MSTFARAEQIQAQIAALKIPVSMHPQRVHPPSVAIEPPSVRYKGSLGGCNRGTATWRLYVVMPDRAGAGPDWHWADETITALCRIFDIESEGPTSEIVDSLGIPQPAIVLTFREPLSRELA